jgi:intracellular sulfur oxidation DsrE/DsrF family protein
MTLIKDIKKEALKLVFDNSEPNIENLKKSIDNLEKNLIKVKRAEELIVAHGGCGSTLFSKERSHKRSRLRYILYKIAFDCGFSIPQLNVRYGVSNRTINNGLVCHENFIETSYKEYCDIYNNVLKDLEG